MTHGLEIVQTPNVVYFLFEDDHWVRRIFMGVREHPDGYPITWVGHSIGKYDGDTLVVDTVNIDDRTWLDSMGHPHSNALHLVERFRRVNHDTLQVDITFDDPKTYTKPWTGKKTFQIQDPIPGMLDNVMCEEWLEMGTKRQPGTVTGTVK